MSQCSMNLPYNLNKRMHDYSTHQCQANAEPEIQNRNVSNKILEYLYHYKDEYGKIDFALDEVQIDTVLLNLNGESSDLFDEISKIAENDNRVLERTIINQQYIAINDQSYIFAKSIKYRMFNLTCQNSELSWVTW